MEKVFGFLVGLVVWLLVCLITTITLDYFGFTEWAQGGASILFAIFVDKRLTNLITK